MQPFTLDKDVALNALLYIAPKVRDFDMYTILKVMYHADKYHLENYGSFISGDSYIAMNYGPVPSFTYDILKAVKAGGSLALDAEVLEEFKSAFEVKGRHAIAPTREADFDFLSKAALESIDYSVEVFGHLPFHRLRDLSHDAAYDAANLDSTMDVEEIAKLFPDSSVLIDYLNDLHPG